MEKLHFDFIGNDTKCYAEIELNGAADSWRAKAKITGHPTIKTLNITYRLGDYLSPMFVSKEDLLLLQPLLLS